MKKGRIALMLFLLLSLNINFAQKKEFPITTSSDEAKQLFVAGRDAMENAEINKAIEFFSKAIEEDEDFALAYLYLALLRTGSPDFTNQLEKAIEHSTKTSEGEKLLIQFGKSVYADKNYKMGMEQLGKLIAMYPTDARLYFYKGIARSIESDSAIVDLNKAAQLNPNYAAVYNTLGYLYLDKGEYEKAESNFKKYISLTPERPNPYDSYAEFLEKTGRYSEAVENYQKALEKDSSNLGEYAKIGNCFIKLGSFNSARENYQMLFEKSPNVSTRLWALRLKIISYVYENKIDEALSKFKDYREYVGEVDDAKEAALSYAYEGYVLAENNRTEEGLEKFQESAIRLKNLTVPKEQKNNFMAHANLDIAYAYAMNNDMMNAKKNAEFAKAETDQMKDPALKTKYEWTLGFIDSKEGSNNKMIERLKNIKGLDALKSYYLAQAYMKLGDKEMAGNLIEEARNANIGTAGLLQLCGIGSWRDPKINIPFNNNQLKFMEAQMKKKISFFFYFLF